MISAADTQDHISGSADAMARHCAEWLCAQAMAGTGKFAICCSGGSTPRAMYEHLAGPDIAPRFPWNRVHWFWGDERFVPPDHPDSNYRMTDAALLSRVPLPAENVHAVPTVGLSPQEAAAAYDRTLQNYYGAGALDPHRSLFAVTLLGVGADGHTASLFPDHPALEERQRWALAVTSGPSSEARITLTYPVLNNSREIAFLVSGEKKRSILERVRAGERALPAARIRPEGRIHWFLDRAAAPAERK